MLIKCEPKQDNPQGSKIPIIVIENVIELDTVLNSLCLSTF